MKLVILHNPGAAHGGIPPEELCAPFAAAGHRVVHRVFGEEDPAEVDPARADAVVVAGGDGTVARFIHSYRRVARRFAILPLGTSNNIATGHGIPRHAAELAAGLDGARARRIDLGTITGPFGERTFLEGVGLGAVSDAMAGVETLDRPGDEKRALSRERLPAILQEAPARRWEVAVDGRALPEALVFLEIMNAPLIGPGLRPDTKTGAPDMGDGLLGVAFLPPGLPPDGRDAFTAPQARGATEAPIRCDLVQGREVTLTWRDALLRIDDEFHEAPGTPQPLRARIDPSDLHLLVPRQQGKDPTR